MAQVAPTSPRSAARPPAPPTIFVTDVEGRVLLVEPAVEPSVLGRRWFELVPADAEETVRAQLALVTATRRAQVVDHDWATGDGRRRFRARVSPILDDGRVLGFVHVALGLQGAVGPQDGCALLDGAGVVIDADDVFSALLRRPPEDVVGNTLPGVEVDEWRDEDAVTAERFRMPEVRAEAGRRTSITVAGRRFHVLQLRSSDRDVVWDAESQRRHSHRLEALGVLASGVAHEINNPLQGILGFAQLIQARSEAGGEVHDFAGEIVHECSRVADIVASLLAFSRRDGGRPSFVDATHLIRSTLLILGSTFRKSDIEVAVAVDEGLPPVPCRGHEIRQVLMNLLTNARDALDDKYPGRDPDKIVRLSASRSESGDALAIRIEDRGTGIPPALVDRIFDPFFTTKLQRQGTGLGLSVSHGIVADHGGRLRVQSEEGVFTRFTLELPFETTG